MVIHFRKLELKSKLFSTFYLNQCMVRIMSELSNKIQYKYELGNVQHMTDFDNFESILSIGKIYSKNKMNQLSKDYVDISNISVQSGRSKITLECTEKALHDYVPLYWGKKTPMVAALQHQNESLLFLMFSTSLLNDYECVISNGNARSPDTSFQVFIELNDLDLLNPRSINTVKYASNQVTKRHKQSELLVLNELPLKHLQYIVCYSSVVKNKVEKLLTTHSVNCRVYIGAGNYYFLE